MKIALILLFAVGLFPLIVNVHGHGIGSETLPPQMIGGYNSTIFLKSWPNTADDSIKETQISLTIYDVLTGEHLHNMKMDLAVSKHGKTLFSDEFAVEEGTFSVIFVPTESLSADETLDRLFENIVEYGIDQKQINQDIFSEGGLYDFDIFVKSVDSFENELQEPVHFVGSLSIPKKFNFETESGQISITTYYDVIESFSITSESAKFLMPFDWSDENISQISVVHQELHIPKEMSSWISNSYDLKVNGILASGSLVTIDDYTLEDERIIHAILSQKVLYEFADDTSQMIFEIIPSSSVSLPLSSQTTNNQYDVTLDWSPSYIEPETPVTFVIDIEDLFVPEQKPKKIQFDVSLVKEDAIIYKKTIHGMKNADSDLNTFQFTFEEAHAGSVKMIIENIDSNEFADTEFVFVVTSPFLESTNLDPSQTTDKKDVPSKSLQKGETLDYANNTFGMFVLAMSLFIVFAYVVMKIKKSKIFMPKWYQNI